MYFSMLIELLRDFPSFAETIRGFPSLSDIVRRIDLEGSFHRYFLIILLLVFSMLYLLQRAKKNLPPGPIAWPIVGNVDLFKSKAHIRLSNLKEQYGDVYSLQVGHYDFIIVCSLEGLMEGLNRSDGVLDGRPDFSVFDHLFKGNKQRGVFTADVDLKSDIKRKFMVQSLDTHCTSPSRIEDEIKRETVNLMCFFLQESGPFDPLECLKFAHLHITMLLIFDERFDSDDLIRDRIFEALDERYASLKIKFHHYFPSLKSFYKENTQRLLLSSDILIRYEKMLLNQHKDTYNPLIIRDLVDQMLLFIETNEDSEILESDDMDDLLLELSGAGFYTVPALLSWLFAYMAAFPDVQQKLQNEIDSIVGRERFPSLEDEPYLPYTISVILEVQRVVTILPFLLPHRAIKSCIFQGYNIPKDSLFLFNVWSLHHDQRYWKNPMKFNPERFLDESGVLSIPDHFMPFGLGHRRCPGESLVEIEVYIMFTCIMHQLCLCASPQARELNLEADFSYILTPKELKIEGDDSFDVSNVIYVNQENKPFIHEEEIATSDCHEVQVPHHHEYCTSDIHHTCSYQQPKTSDISSQTDLTMTDIDNLIEMKEKFENPDGLLRDLFIQKVTKSDENVMKYTGVPSKHMLKSYFGILDNASPTLKYWSGPSSAPEATYQQNPGMKKSGPNRKLSRYEEFILTLIRMRLAVFTFLLADIFGVSSSRISQICITWINYMYCVVAPLLKWPSSNHVKKFMPKCFRLAYPDTICIIDCTEIFIEKPRSPTAQSQTYSNYKHHNTFKALVGITPSGAFTFVSKLWGGNTSDRHITKESGFLDNVRSGDQIMADRGFLIRDLLLERGARLVIPPFTKKCTWGKGKRLNSSDIVKTKNIARLRIHVERAIERLKNFHILSSTMPLSLKPVSNQVLTVCAFMCNLQKPLVK